MRSATKLILGFLAIAWAMLPIPALAANLDLLHASIAASYVALSAKLAEYQKLPCLTSDSADHLKKFQQSSLAQQTALTISYQSYKAIVSKPMDGNGRCDGGFDSVVVESEKRRKQTEEFKKAVNKINDGQRQADEKNFGGAEIDMPDDADGFQCSSKGSEIYDAIELSQAAVFVNMGAFSQGVAAVEENFRSYIATNKALGSSCGAASSGLSGVFSADIPGVNAGAAPYSGSEQPHGNSGISGSIDNANLNGKGGSRSDSAISASAGGGDSFETSFDQNLSNDKAAREFSRAEQKIREGKLAYHSVTGSEKHSGRGDLLGAITNMAELSEKSEAKFSAETTEAETASDTSEPGEAIATPTLSAGAGGTTLTTAQTQEEANTELAKRIPASGPSAPAAKAMPRAEISPAEAPSLFQLVHFRIMQNSQQFQ